MKINHLSVSRTQTYQLCPQQYKYKYHLELPTLEEEPLYFAYGSIVHKIAEVYVTGKGQTSISEVADGVMSGRIPLDYGKKIPNLPLEYKQKMVDHLKSLKKITDQIGYEGFTEFEFEFDLDPTNGKKVIGYIDRLIVKGDKIWVLDYKTTKKGWWRKGPKDIVNDLQLRCYSKVIQDKFNVKAENIKAALYYLDGGNLVGAIFSQQSLDSVARELLKVYREIEHQNPDNVVGKDGEWCRRCNYRKICPYTTSTNE